MTRALNWKQMTENKDLIIRVHFKKDSVWNINVGYIKRARLG